MRRAPALLIVLALAGCSGVFPYPNTLEKNLEVRSQTKSGSAFASVRASLAVHSVDERCRTEYQGSIALDGGSAAVGLPPGRWSYLVVVFSGSSWFSGSSSVSKAALLRPEPGRRYELAMSYVNDLYDVTLSEIPPRGGARPLELRGMEACRRLRPDQG